MSAKRRVPVPDESRSDILDVVPEIVMESPVNRGTIYGWCLFPYAEGRKKEGCREDDIDWTELGRSRDMIARCSDSNDDLGFSQRRRRT